MPKEINWSQVSGSLVADVMSFSSGTFIQFVAILNYARETGRWLPQATKSDEDAKALTIEIDAAIERFEALSDEQKNQALFEARLILMPIFGVLVVNAKEIDGRLYKFFRDREILIEDAIKARKEEEKKLLSLIT